MTWNYFKRRIVFLLWNGDSKLRFKNLRYLPRWVILVFDILLVLFSSVVTYNVINRLTHQFYDIISVEAQFVLVAFVYLCSFIALSTYSGVIRHSTFVDVLKIAVACVLSNVVLAGINYTSYFFFEGKIFLMPFLVINMSITFISMLFFRLAVKTAYQSFTQRKYDKKNVLIYEVNDETIALAEAIKLSKDDRYNLVGFISPKKNHRKIKILGRQIIKFDDQFLSKIEPLKIDGIIMPSRIFKDKVNSRLVDFCLDNSIQVYRSPTIEVWDEGNSDLISGIRQIQIEDLLERTEIVLDDTSIRASIENKVILITGGAGSIGSEIVRQVSAFAPQLIIIIDQAESPLYNVSLELQNRFTDVNFKFILGDIRNKERLREIFLDYDVSIIYHAAAYKHVPLVEENPKEAIDVNVIGTMNLADLSCEYGIDRFVMVSTDKAVNPTNVMGATKRAAEIYVQSLNNVDENRTTFITTRFGNVLGSNGSVIPHFKKLIEKGGPVTVTHENIFRYFMTIPEACQLVLQAGTMGKGGEIFVFDMGEPVKILSLAEKMIRLSGFEPYKEIDIKITGLRPGEKLYEELLSDNSTTLPTHNEKILIAKQEEVLSHFEINDLLNNIIIAAASNDNLSVVKNLKILIPEYKSRNSVFESLDYK